MLLTLREVCNGRGIAIDSSRQPAPNHRSNRRSSRIRRTGPRDRSSSPRRASGGRGSWRPRPSSRPVGSTFRNVDHAISGRLRKYSWAIRIAPTTAPPAAMAIAAAAQATAPGCRDSRTKAGRGRLSRTTNNPTIPALMNREAIFRFWSRIDVHRDLHSSGGYQVVFTRFGRVRAKPSATGTSRIRPSRMVNGRRPLRFPALEN